MGDANDLRFDFISLAACRLGVPRQAIEFRSAVGAAVGVGWNGLGQQQERLDGGKEPYEGRARQKRRVCA